MRKISIFALIFSCVLTSSTSWAQATALQSAKSIKIEAFPDNVICEVGDKGVGMNLDFFMDGGRFPEAKVSVAQAMKRMGVKYLRYPGGEKSDIYLFSTPPYDTPRVTLARKGAKVCGDYNEVIYGDSLFRYPPLDFDGFISICKEAGAEPVIVVAADCYLLNDGDIATPREKLLEHAAAWVRYSNIVKKYGVKYWMIANESWNDNNLNSSATRYAKDVIDFSKAMKAVDPSILIIPNTHKDDFSKTLIEVAGDHFDMICNSNYTVLNYFAGYDTYKDTLQYLAGAATTVVNSIDKYATEEQKKRWKLIVAEYGPIDWSQNWPDINDMGHAIVTFDMTAEITSQPKVAFSCFWNTRWISNHVPPAKDHDALDPNGNFTPVGRSVMILGKYLEQQMVESSSVGYVKSFASYGRDNKRLLIYLINKDSAEQQVDISVKGHKIKMANRLVEFYGTSPQDLSPTWNDKKVRLKNESINLLGTSITVVELVLR